MQGDIVIVGGGPAGLTTAIALVRALPAAAARLVVLEKERYPRDKFCAGAIGRRGDLVLERLGAAPDVPSVRIDGISARTRDGEASARPGGIARVVRRIEFDEALARIAARLGVRIEENVAVAGVVPRADDRGAIVETSRGAIEAAVVVGADGVGSVVRRSMGLSFGSLRAQVLEVDTEPVAGDRDRAYLHFDIGDRTLTGYAWDFPTIVDGRPLVCRGLYQLRIEGGGAGEKDLAVRLGARLAAIGLDLDRCVRKRYAERGFEPSTRFADETRMLVGEAAGVDAVTGEGIPQAIEHGAIAGAFLADAVATRRPIACWNGVVRRSRATRDLRVRRFVMRRIFGEARPDVEAYTLGCRNALDVGCRQFAAMPLPPLALAEALAHGGWHLLAGAARRALRPVE
ncbi:MAG: NAD(P)/FAD-dependent oxidoreductase [Myxococcota bacterium]